MTDISQFLATSEAARLLGVSDQQVRWMSKTGRLPCVSTAVGRLYDPAIIEALARERAARPRRLGRRPASSGG